VIGRPILNRKRGTALLPVTVPGPGFLGIRGRGVRLVRREGERMSSPSHRRWVHRRRTVRLLIGTAGAKKHRLHRLNRVRVRLRITFSALTGSEDRVTAITLRRRRR
jgi:hypothetical protein